MPYVMTGEVEIAADLIISKLKNDAAVAAIIGVKAWRDRAPQGVEFPYIVVTSAQPVPVLAQDQHQGISRIAVEVRQEVASGGDLDAARTQAAALGRAVDAALHGVHEVASGHVVTLTRLSPAVSAPIRDGRAVITTRTMVRATIQSPHA